jgi:hypothetical protein
VLVQGVVAGSATPVDGSTIRQMNLVPYAAVPFVANPAVCIACRPVVEPFEGSAPQPRSIWLWKWAKSTTTITPRVVEQLLTVSAATGLGASTTKGAAVTTATAATKNTRAAHRPTNPARPRPAGRGDPKAGRRRSGRRGMMSR